MKRYICIISLLFFLFSLAGCQKDNKNKQTDSSNVEENIKVEELLYGKYPEPILIAVGENNDVKKDYKKLTKDDLKKIKYLNFEYEYEQDKRYINKKYGLEEDKAYDFSILLEMPNLTSLSVDFGNSNIRLKDYSILNELKNLQHLSVSNLCDEDMNNIVGFNSLNELSISHSSITNLDFLKHLNKLPNLYLDSVPNIKNFQTLTYLKNVDSINICNSNITEKELKTVPDMNTLKSLSLTGNSLKNITSFPAMENLECLILASNPIKSLNVKSDKLPKLKYLNIVDTLISNANNINGVDNVEELIIKNTPISKVAPFKKYKNLKFINANLKNIKDTDMLKNTNILINEE